MTSKRRALQQELEEWKRALPLPTSGRKAGAARQLRDNLRAFTFGFRDWLEESMRPQGMTVAQLRMLFAVRYEPEASSARIARLCQVTPQTMQAMLQRAVREGWILRHTAAQNARILVSSLTPEGEALLQQAMDATSAFELEVWRDASATELLEINRVFAAALRRMDKVASMPMTTAAPQAPSENGRIEPKKKKASGKR